MSTSKTVNFALALPWALNDCGLIFGQAPDNDAEAPLIADCATDRVAASLGILEPMEWDRARYIVDACNAHHALVAALRLLRSDCDMALCGEWDRSNDGFEAMLDVIDQALRKAGVE
jgi:hypothetical protein